MMPVTVLELRVTSRSLAPCGGRVTGSLPVGSGLPDSEAAQSPTVTGSRAAASESGFAYSSGRESAAWRHVVTVILQRQEL